MEPNDNCDLVESKELANLAEEFAFSADAQLQEAIAGPDAAQ